MTAVLFKRDLVLSYSYYYRPFSARLHYDILHTLDKQRWDLIFTDVVQHADYGTIRLVLRKMTKETSEEIYVPIITGVIEWLVITGQLDTLRCIAQIMPKQFKQKYRLMELACASCRPEIIRFLRAYTPLLGRELRNTVSMSSPAMVDYITNEWHRDDVHRSAFVGACMCGSRPAVERLIRYATPQALDSGIYQAEFHGHYSLVLWFVDRGDINNLDECIKVVMRGGQSRHDAHNDERDMLIRELIKRGAVYKL